jgi:hypothetical protein
MLPQPLIEQYWDRVRGILQKDYHLKRNQSDQAVSRYRGMVEPKAGQMIYHQDAKEVAGTIAQAVKSGSLPCD